MGDQRVSWCRILRNGPPCPHLCADCKRTDATLTEAERQRILADRDQAGVGCATCELLSDLHAALTPYSSADAARQVADDAAAATREGLG